MGVQVGELACDHSCWGRHSSHSILDRYIVLRVLTAARFDAKSIVSVAETVSPAAASFAVH